MSGRRARGGARLAIVTKRVIALRRCGVMRSRQPAPAPRRGSTHPARSKTVPLAGAVSPRRRWRPSQPPRSNCHTTQAQHAVKASSRGLVEGAGGHGQLPIRHGLGDGARRRHGRGAALRLPLWPGESLSSHLLAKRDGARVHPRFCCCCAPPQDQQTTLTIFAGVSVLASPPPPPPPSRVTFDDLSDHNGPRFSTCSPSATSRHGQRARSSSAAPRAAGAAGATESQRPRRESARRVRRADRSTERRWRFGVISLFFFCFTHTARAQESSSASGNHPTRRLASAASAATARSG